ncbi:bromodomain-containing protein 8-like isoform X2 [Corticium candelabrum]|uniref:bromodomain-containing protein 8-like isoform X2 n=1 Tax=Corticium candelabrum TaxID=121492 RepID=UPI002E25BA6A|nr:bromodomain-containing protein 8-like isoform X2 [Corticium candelabrum]
MHRTSGGGHGQTGQAGQASSQSDWTIRERLVLSSSVLNSGDQNWVSVSRTVKPLLEAGVKQPDKFSQKNCALEYSDMLEKVAPLKRKRSTEIGTGETPGERIVRRLTFERIEELKKSIKTQHALYKKLKQEAKLIAEGKVDHNLEQMWQEIEAEKRAEAQMLGLPIKDLLIQSVVGSSSQVAPTTTTEVKQEHENVEHSDAQIGSSTVTPTESNKTDKISPKPEAQGSCDVTKSEHVVPSGEQRVDREKDKRASRVDHVDSSKGTNDQTDGTTCSADREKTGTETITKGQSHVDQTKDAVSKPKPGSQDVKSTKDERKEEAVTGGEGHDATMEDASTIEDDDVRRESETDATISPEEMSVEDVNINEVDNGSEEQMKSELKQEITVEASADVEMEDAAPVAMETLEGPSVDEDVSERGKGKANEEEEKWAIESETKSQPQETETSNEQNEEPRVEKNQRQAKDVDVQAVDVHTVEKQTDSLNNKQSETQSVATSASDKLSTSHLIVPVTTQESVSEQRRVATKPDLVVPPQRVASLSNDPATSKSIPASLSSITRPLILRPIHKTAVPAVTPTEPDPVQSSPVSVSQSAANATSSTVSAARTLSPAVVAVNVSHSPIVPLSQSLPVASTASSESSKPGEVTAGDHSMRSKVKEEKTVVEAASSQAAVSSIPDGQEKKKENPVAAAGSTKDEPCESTEAEEIPIAACYSTFEHCQTKLPEPCERRLSDQSGSLSHEADKSQPLQPPKRPKTNQKRIRRSSMRTRSRGHESDSPVDEDSRESFADLESELIAMVASDEKCIVPNTPPPANTTEETVTKAVNVDQSEQNALVNTEEADEDPEEPRTVEGGEALEEESTVEEEDTQSFMLSALSSAPSSPPTSVGDVDAESAQARRTWKKSIIVLWRKIAEHRYANLFLKAVSEKEAPGYRDVVYRPTDLTTIKANLENGTLRTTEDFQHSVLLMFQNALMYNASDHEVYGMASQMRADFLVQVEEFVALQVIVNSQPDRKSLRGISPALRSKRSDKDEQPVVRQTVDEVEAAKRSRRPSTDSTDQPPAKRRKVRGDDQ